MVEVGRERDKQIAELKLEPYEIVKGELLTLGYDKQTALPFWSTSWNDAKELWDELPYTTSISRYEENLYRIIIPFNTTYGRIFFDGKDFPDAVSQAWLKWKEHNHHANLSGEKEGGCQ